jgi:hypothetical protein
MLDLDAVDLRAIGEALEDHSGMSRTTVDPKTGEVEHWPGDDTMREEGDDEPSEHLLAIDPLPSHVGYSDMEDFIARVSDPRARDVLASAIGGRGAFRRFKDALLELPDLRDAWFAFHDTRMQRRAIDWLRDQELIDDAAAQAALAKRSDPDLPAIAGPFDAEGIARRVAADLKGLYGARLKGVLLFGSWARGDAHPESDIDLLVILDKVDSVWDESQAMDAIMWHHSFANDTVIAQIVIGEAEAERAEEPVIVRAMLEGKRIA